MKKGWTYKKLGEVCNKLNGLWKGKKPPYVKVGVIRNANFTKDFSLNFDNIEYLDVEKRQFENRKLQQGDLIVEKSGGSEKQPVGRAVLFNKEEGEYSFSNFTSVLRIKDKSQFQSDFLYKYLLFIYQRGDTKKMQNATTGIHNIEFEKYLDINIPYIPLSEQQQIVSRLDAAFAHIDELKANAEKQLNEARKIFQNALTKAMEPKEGWEEKKLGEVCVFSQGIQVDVNLQTEICSPGKVRFLRIIDVTQGNVPPRYIDDPGERYYLRADEIAMVRYGTVGFVCYGFEGVIANNLFKISIKDKSKLQNNYLQYFLKSDLFQSHIRKGVGGAALPAIKFGDIKHIILGVPPLSEQQAIVSRLDALNAHVKELEEVLNKTITECDALKQALLRKVFE